MHKVTILQWSNNTTPLLRLELEMLSPRTQAPQRHSMLLHCRAQRPQQQRLTRHLRHLMCKLQQLLLRPALMQVTEPTEGVCERLHLFE